MFSLGLAGVVLLTIVRLYFPTIVAASLLSSWLACFFVTRIQRTFRKTPCTFLASVWLNIGFTAYALSINNPSAI